MSNRPDLSLGLFGIRQFPAIGESSGVYRFDTGSHESAELIAADHGEEIAKWLWRTGRIAAEICVKGEPRFKVNFKPDHEEVSRSLRETFNYEKNGGNPKTMIELQQELLETGIAIGRHTWTIPCILEMANWANVGNKVRFGMVLREVEVYDRHDNFLFKEEPMRQLALSSAVAEQIKLKGVSLEEATRRVTSDYTLRTQESEDWWRDAYRELEPNNPASWVTRKGSLVHDTTFNNWREFDSQIKLIQIVRFDYQTGNKIKELFSVSRGLDVREIADPRKR